MSIESRIYGVKPNAVIESMLLIIVSKIRFDLLPKRIRQGYLSFITSDWYHVIYGVLVCFLAYIWLGKAGII